MPATVESLKELHSLHQRAKAVRDRMASGPKTLAAREVFLANRQAALEKAKKDLKDARAHTKNRETELKTVENRIDERKIQRNSVKKQADYDAITNQIAHDTQTKSKLEDEILQSMDAIEHQVAELAKFEADVKALEGEVAKLRADLEAQRGPQAEQLREIEELIAAAENLIPENQREQYRRVLKQRGPDAMAAVQREDGHHDQGSCTGCFVTLTTQMLNELYTVDHLTFCLTCGRILYLAEETESMTTRRQRP